ncbi:hypothetical protein VNO77_18244 [Canavalia gladiata]|uniref:Uncharacterized protein n=1 Tax=Canavalia gladiata TaxID=3824 RepID=A0AAN9LNU1_CANGL
MGCKRRIGFLPLQPFKLFKSTNPSWYTTQKSRTTVLLTQFHKEEPLTHRSNSNLLIPTTLLPSPFSHILHATKRGY